MDESMTTSVAHADPGRPVLENVRSIIVRMLFAAMAFLFLYRLSTWILASMFYPAPNDLALHAFHCENAIRHQVPTDKPWFISSGFIAIVRFLRSLPFEYRLPAIHLLDDALLIGFFMVMAVWSRRVFSSLWPAVLGTTFIIGRLFETSFLELSDRDWFAAMFAFAGVLAAGAFESRRAAILGGTLWMIGLQFRPQPVLLLPCLAMARLSLFQGDRPGLRDFRKAFADTVIGLAFGFVLVHVPLWMMGGFPDYYVDTLRFMSQGGHGGKSTSSLILRNFASLITRQHDFSYVLIYPSILLLTACCRPRLGLWLLTVICSLLAATLWASVNHIVLGYHEFPMLIAEAIALGTIAGCVMTLYPNRHEPTRILALVFCFCLAYWSSPVISIRGSLRENIAKIRNRDYSPVSVSSKFNNAEYPLRSWDLDRQANRELFDFFNAKIDSETIPFEKIDIDQQSLGCYPFFLRNPGAVGNNWSWLIVLDDLTDRLSKSESNEVYLKFLASLKSNSDGYVMWIPSQAKWDLFRLMGHDLTEEVRAIFETIESHYEPVAKFGEIEIRRKKPASNTP